LTLPCQVTLIIFSCDTGIAKTRLQDKKKGCRKKREILGSYHTGRGDC